MYQTTLPAITRGWLLVTDFDFHKAVETDNRSHFDFETRMSLLRASDGDTVSINSYADTFDAARNYWSWYADTLKTNIKWVPTHLPFPAYPKAPIPIGVFTSESPSGYPTGGIESTIVRHQLYDPLYLHLTVDTDQRKIGMLEGAIAIYSAARGIQTAFIGDERYSGVEDRSVGEQFSHREGIEQTESWWLRWNQYVGPKNSIQSLVGIWHKDELILKAHELEGNLAHVTSCVKSTSERVWCGDCWKCYVTKKVLDSKGLDSSFIDLTPGCIERARKEYADYLSNGIDLFRSCGILSRLPQDIL